MAWVLEHVDLTIKRKVAPMANKMRLQKG